MTCKCRDLDPQIQTVSAVIVLYYKSPQKRVGKGPYRTKTKLNDDDLGTHTDHGEDPNGVKIVLIIQDNGLNLSIFFSEGIQHPFWIFTFSAPPPAAELELPTPLWKLSGCSLMQSNLSFNNSCLLLVLLKRQIQLWNL